MDMPLGCISRIDESKKTDPTIDIYLKDLRIVKMSFVRDADKKTALNLLFKNYLLFPQKPTHLFAFFYNEKYPHNGWNVFDTTTEFSRQSVPSHLWRLSHINDKYEQCASYPSVLAVPENVSDKELVSVFRFRSKGRIPVLSWKHPHSNASICRCSQPLVGMFGSRCPDDEKLLTEILKTNPGSSTLYIIDCRPKANAFGNRAKGAGYEHAEYSNCKLEFAGIANIHAMRDSLNKLHDCCNSPNEENFYSQLESSRWFEHLQTILNGVIKVVNLVAVQNCSVLLHCSDGWDRTAQLSSLAELLMDPYYRTLVGFECLIEKEWLSFGHKFDSRYGHGDKNFADEDRSPVFPQFLDLVWQLQQQFPFAFEFGTFLCNTEKERVELALKTKTHSIWSYVNSNASEFLNPFYRPEDGVLIPSSSLKDLKLWKACYMHKQSPYQPELRVTELFLNSCRLNQKVRQLEFELKKLKEKIPN